MADIPQPVKRKQFSPRDVAAVFIKSDGRCAACSEKVRLGEYQIDHITPLDLMGAHELANWQLLCVPCHKLKTAGNVKASAKARRLRGDTSTQASRRAERGPQIKSRALIETRESRSPQKILSAGFRKPPGFKHKWAKRKVGQ